MSTITSNALENCFFHISCYSRAYLRVITEKTKSQVPRPGTSVGKQNTKAKLSFTLKIEVSVGLLNFTLRYFPHLYVLSVTVPTW